MHIVTLVRDLYDGHLLHHLIFEQQFHSLIGAADRGTLAAAYHHMLRAHHHHVTTFQRRFFVLLLTGAQEMMNGLWYFQDIITICREQGMIKENVPRQQSLTRACLFCRFVQQHIIVYGDADIARKDQVRDGGADHLVITDRS